MLRRLLLTACLAAGFVVTANASQHARLFRQPDASAPPGPTVPKEGWSKAYLFAQPNATTPAAVALLEDVEAEILEEYAAVTLAYIKQTWLDFVRSRAQALSLGLFVHDDADRIYAGRTVIDSRIGIARSLRGETLDPPYTTEDVATWIVQFHGIEKLDWVPSVEREGAVVPERMIWNAVIVAATPSQIGAIAAKPYVQFHTQLHSVMKKAGSLTNSEAPLWIYLAKAGGYEASIARIRSLAAGAIEVRFGDRSALVTGTFAPSAVDAIAREPLVYAVAGALPPLPPPPTGPGSPVAIPTLSPTVLMLLATALAALAATRAR